MRYSEEKKRNLSILIEGICTHHGVHINPVIIRILNYDIYQAILLSQYAYICAGKNGEEFLYQDKNFMYIFGSKDKISRAKKSLEKKGLISITLKGLPARSYIKVNLELLEKLKLENAIETYESIPCYMSENPVSHICETGIANVINSNKDNNKDNIPLERKKKEVSPSAPQGERSSDDELSLSDEEKNLKKMFEEDLWNNPVTTGTGKSGSKKLAFEKWKKITKNGKVNRKEVIDGWERYVAFQKHYGYSIKRLQFFLNPKLKQWEDEWKIEEGESKKEKSSFKHHVLPKFWAECLFAEGVITREEYSEMKERTDWKFVKSAIKAICEKKHKEGFYPKQNIEGRFRFTSDEREKLSQKSNHEKNLIQRAEQLEAQNPEWREASKKAETYESLQKLALSDEDLFEKIEVWCNEKELEKIRAEQEKRLKKEQLLKELQEDRDDAINEKTIEFYDFVEENYDLEAFFNEHSDEIGKLKIFFDGEFSLGDALCNVELSKNFKYLDVANRIKLDLFDHLKDNETFLEKRKKLKEEISEINKIFNQKMQSLEKEFE